MSMIIAHNMSAINTQRQFGVSARGMSTSMERLSSGYKINTGKDDPSGLLISEKLRSQLAGIQRAKQNTEEAMNVLGIAEGALNEMNNIMKKMKSLATHAANNGITSADQIAADQSELDSGIQTMDRIAQTTQFARDNILNGAKEIAYDLTTNVKGTQQNNLVNSRESAFNQIFKRDGYTVSISFTGGRDGIGYMDALDGGWASDGTAGVAHPGSALTGDGRYVDFSKQATKAYMEIDTAIPNTSVVGGGFPKSQVKDGLFTQEQLFTLTGSRGSRQFTFPKGASVTDMVKDIHATVGATGIDAALVFNSAQTVDPMLGVDATGKDVANGTAIRQNGAANIFGSYRDKNTGEILSGATGVTNLEGVQWGRNTDGQGNIYIKYITDTEVEFYKDSSMTAESKVAVGKVDSTGECAFQAVNNSGLSGKINVVNNGKPEMNLPDVRGNYINTGGIEGNNKTNTDPAIDAMTWSGNVAIRGAGGGVKMAFDADRTAVTGIELGKNTSAEGQIFFKTVNDGNTVQVFAYKGEKMEAKDLVAKSVRYDITKGSPKTITLDEVRDSNDTFGTGLGIIFSVGSTTAFTPAEKGSVTGSLSFNNLGARIFATDYGSKHFVKVVQDKGSIFTSYDSPGDPTRTMLDAGEKGQTKLIYGQDATISVNGMQVRTDGLRLKMATQDIQADLVFNAGKVGSTTLAQVGYDDGSPFTKIGMLNNGDNKPVMTGADKGLSAYLCNAGHSTSEVIDEFKNGMQLQLGEGPGDQNRTVVSLRSMTTENIGRITRGGYWDVASPSVWSEKTFCLKDCFGGGAASLSVDPTLTMAVIDKAIDDISQQRALIGAVQANLLQTNANNLEVTFENVTKTESGIRDADMAGEMSEFTRNQVLQNAAMSMMGQANQRSQSVLQLLQ